MRVCSCVVIFKLLTPVTTIVCSGIVTVQAHLNRKDMKKDVNELRKETKCDMPEMKKELRAEIQNIGGREKVEFLETREKKLSLKVEGLSTKVEKIDLKVEKMMGKVS